MTHIKCLKKGNIVIGFEMEGHAGYNTYGFDILCSSLSTISQATINGLLVCANLQEEHVEIRELPSIAYLAVSVAEDAITSEAVALLESYKLFVKLLSEDDEYKKHVVVEEVQI